MNDEAIANYFELLDLKYVNIDILVNVHYSDQGIMLGKYQNVIAFQDEIVKRQNIVEINLASMPKEKILSIKIVLQKYKNDFEIININNDSFQVQKDLKIRETEPVNESNSVDIEELDKNFILAIQEYWKIKENSCKELLNYIENLNLDDSKSLGSKKLELKLSVPEITLLFRLLDEEKLINYKHKTEIYKFIADSFKTSKQDNISQSSVKNKYLSPDSRSLENLKVLLTNLKILLQQIEKNQS